MSDSGFFITLYDEDTLQLYLQKGIYSFLMPPIENEISSRSRHYQALADYACGRDGTHVFFFLKRQIVYGGQLIGSEKYGSFYLNGPYCPMGKISGSKIVWDESKRGRYKTTNRPGIFIVQTATGENERCQPYLMQFDDKRDLKGQTIASDDLYFELGTYPYPLPSNAIQDMSFCTLTPREVEILIDLLTESKKNIFAKPKDDVTLSSNPLSFNPSFGLLKLTDAISEAHVEASVLANPDLLPAVLQPPKNSGLCRQVPVSPFKPANMDRADICYYTKDKIREGTIPNIVIELKYKQAGRNEVNQVLRYHQWLHKIVPQDIDRIKFYLFAPTFKRGAHEFVPRELRSQIQLIPFYPSTLI
jgi:hypothetical protein